MSRDAKLLAEAINEVADVLRETLDYCRLRDSFVQQRDDLWRHEEKDYAIKRDQSARERADRQDAYYVEFRERLKQEIAKDAAQERGS